MNARRLRLALMRERLVERSRRLRVEAAAQSAVLDPVLNVGDQIRDGAGRGFDGFDIERHQSAQVDNLGINALFGQHRFGDVDHRAIGQDGQRLACVQ